MQTEQSKVGIITLPYMALNPKQQNTPRRVDLAAAAAFCKVPRCAREAYALITTPLVHISLCDAEVTGQVGPCRVLRGKFTRD